MKLLWVSFVISFLYLGLPLCTVAVTNDFTVTTVIGGDTMAPTTPIIVSVVPIASTQIDITWTAATDDVAVAGYRVFRGGVQIATTTLLSYSDAGLMASTTYSYFIDAFDTTGNFSSSSATVATTTQAAPVVVATSTPTTTNAGSSGTAVGDKVLNFVITTTKRSARFIWETQGPTTYTVVWGRTLSYELGSVSGIIFAKKHITNIDSLEPGTVYFYQVSATDVRGTIKIISSDQFTTKNNEAAQSLPSVQSFNATAEGNDVRLSWNQNFSNPDWYVRVVRSHLFYPTTIQSGAVVYEGRGQSFIDREALRDRSPQYYTIFMLDSTGAVSAGAVAQAYKQAAPSTGTATTSPELAIPSLPSVEIGDDTILQASSISISQGAVNQTTVAFDAGVVLEIRESYVVSIPVSAVPKNLKSIIITVQNPSNQRDTSAYLLKLNPDGDAYTARIEPLGVVGQARMIIEVFDYEQATVRRIVTAVSFIDSTIRAPFFPDRLLSYGGLVLAGILLVGLSSWPWWLLAARRCRRD